MANIDSTLQEAMTIEGAIGVALVDYTSGLTLGVLGGGGLDMTVAAAGNTDVVRAKLRTLEMLGLPDGIEDLLITLDTQYHLIRLMQPRRPGEALLLYMVLDRSRANLGLARHRLRRVEAELEI